MSRSRQNRRRKKRARRRLAAWRDARDAETVGFALCRLVRAAHNYTAHMRDLAKRIVMAVERLNEAIVMGFTQGPPLILPQLPLPEPPKIEPRPLSLRMHQPIPFRFLK
jgi:hypothetical protein